MRIVSATIVIQRPIHQVFAFVTDARNNPLWQFNSGLKSVRQMPEDAVGVGTWIADSWLFMGRTRESTSEVIAYEPNRRYTRHLLTGFSPIKQGTYVFEPVANGTRWIFTALVHAGGIFTIADPLLASYLKRRLEANMAEAKAVLER